MLQQHPHLQAVIATGIANEDLGISDLKVTRHNVAAFDYAKQYLSRDTTREETPKY